MQLFPERLVADLEHLSGANHCFLKQLCGPAGSASRARLQSQVALLSPLLRERAIELLSSLDNRRFFQGFAEVSSLAALRRGGWEGVDLVRPGARIELVRPGRGSDAGLVLSVLAFLHQSRPGGEEETRKRLLDSLARVASRQRFAVLVRRWLPHDFDPEPVRQAIELWLGQVQSGQWEGRYAAYEDDRVSLEFCLTGERAKARQSPVALTIGPFYANRTLEVLEPRLVNELDRHRVSASRGEPVLVACVADQPWALTNGYVRDFLYGRPTRTHVGEGPSEWEFGGPASVSVFRDPLYSCVSGVVFLDRDPHRPVRLRARAWLNPWADVRLTPNDLGLRTFAADPSEVMSGGGDARVLRWYEEEVTGIDL